MMKKANRLDLELENEVIFFLIFRTLRITDMTHTSISVDPGVI